jgi:hypothetical protein
MFNLFSRLKEPAIFQGNLNNKDYFEGWYFKQSSILSGDKLAIIPGISLTSEDRHAFIQVFEGTENKSYYFRYPLTKFKPRKSPFRISIGENHFGYSGLELNIDGEIVVRGKVEFSDMWKYKGKPWMRGIMGWYGYVPFLETYHGLLSLDHQVNGNVSIDDLTLSFQNASGYIEKDWGTSFPSAWIWMQGNSFPEYKTSFMISVAVIPWIGSSFVGHLAILLYKGKIINLSTYAGGKVTKLSYSENGVCMRIESNIYRLDVEAVQGKSVDLKSPEKGVMNGRTVESLSSHIRIKVHDKRMDKVLYCGETSNSGLELMDSLNILPKSLNLV